jgi:hypothetical protein
MRKTAQAKSLKSHQQSHARQQKPRTAISTPISTYKEFDQLDGRHPFASAVPDACVHYQVRKLNEGKITYFNFDLAKEMGLISRNHPHKMSKQLESKLLETFSLRIINEYDIKRKIKFDATEVKKYPFMATRYLQLQHRNKKGQTSGDGRSIWNGVIRYRGKVWDVSSRGTGVTCLAPGFVKAGKPLKTGGTEFGYGCGTADIDELISSALMSEIYHRQQIKTERMLTVVDLGNGLGIGVRASENLFRPAHFFALLKQGKRRELERATDFIIRRQTQNGRWNIKQHGGHKYDQMLHYIARDFGRFAAKLEANYLFVWLDWDGDNVLVDPGIIDYGSVRQFGLFHESYRFDDIERFSTNIIEQRRKSREIVQTFVQLTQFLKTGRKSAVEKFRKHWSCKLFEREFEKMRLKCFLTNLGFDEKQIRDLGKKHGELCSEFFEVNRHFESQKTKRKATKLPDGVIQPAIFNMKSLWSEYPRRLMSNGFSPLPEAEFFELILAQSASGTDLKFQKSLGKHIRKFQSIYMDLVEGTAGNWKQTLQRLSARASVIARPDRLTGNSIECVTEEILKAQAKGLQNSDIQKIMEAVIQNQAPSQNPRRRGSLILLDNPAAKSLLEKVQNLLMTYQEDI